MPINPNLLITAPVFQYFLEDKTGIPMANGTVTCYQDNSRTTLKNWYYQSGTPGNYTYIALPNPLTLSAAGTVCDLNGVDTLPFFYPYSEVDQSQRQPYFITIVNQDRTNQITRANFPYLGNGGGGGGGSTALDNYIINNVFWRNIGTMSLTTVLQTTVAPSQHDGFRYPDIQFIKNNTNGIDTVTFTKFALSNTSALTGDITPEFYLNHTCSNSATGETQKCYQFPISLHVNTLDSVTATVTIQMQNAGGTSIGENVVNLFILQDTGTGTSSPFPILVNSITVNSSWTKYESTLTLPTTSGLTLGAGEDDALYLQVQMPLNSPCSVNFTKPSIYLSSSAPTNSFATYDQIDAIINSPRTGDNRSSFNSFYPFGWVPANDGVIGENAMMVVATTTLPGYTRANNDTWQLYNLLWTLAKPFDSGTMYNPICQMYTNTGTVLTATNYGASAYADFTANNALQLTKQFGRVMMGTVPMSALFTNYQFQNQPVIASDSTGNLLFTPTSIAGIYTGVPIYFTFAMGGSYPGNILANVMYYATQITSTTFEVAISYADAIAGTPVIPYVSDGMSVIVSFNYTGIPLGEPWHTQLEAELAAHNHPGSTAPVSSLGIAGPTLGSSQFIVAGGATALDIATDGSSKPFNLIQPSTLCNIFIKL